MQPDSKTETGRPSGPSWSRMAGILLLGLIFRNSGVNWSPLSRLRKCSVYASPHSSNMMWIFWPFGVVAV